MNRRDALKGLATLFAAPALKHVALPVPKTEFFFPVNDNIVVFETVENYHINWKEFYEEYYKRLKSRNVERFMGKSWIDNGLKTYNYIYGSITEQGCQNNQRSIGSWTGQGVDTRGIGLPTTLQARREERSGGIGTTISEWVTSATKHQQQSLCQDNNGSGWGTSRDFTRRGSESIFERPEARHNGNLGWELYIRPTSRHNLQPTERERIVEATDQWRTNFAGTGLPDVWPNIWDTERSKGYQHARI